MTAVIKKKMNPTVRRHTENTKAEFDGLELKLVDKNDTHF